jgi:hypothetical protein
MLVHWASVVNHIPERLRIHLFRARRDPQLLGELPDFINELGGLSEVQDFAMLNAENRRPKLDDDLAW